MKRKANGNVPIGLSFGVQIAHIHLEGLDGRPIRMEPIVHTVGFIDIRRTINRSSNSHRILDLLPEADVRTYHPTLQ